MNGHELAIVVLLGLAATGALYFAVNSTPNQDSIPQFQTEAQMMGLNVNAGIRLGTGTPLDLNTSCHFWDPQTNPRDKNPPCGVVTTPHRYPSVPGGNISTIIHKGWSAMSEDAPSDNTWFDTPPSVAVL